MRRLPGIVAGLLLAVVVTGCQVSASVEVDARADGSGRVHVVVTLDRDAVATVGDLRRELVVEDLRRAGWRIDGPDRLPDGGARVTATKPFRAPEGANRALDELTGPSGALSSLRLTRSTSALRTRTQLGGAVDLRPGLAVFSDEALTRKLGGRPLGIDTTELRRSLDIDLERSFELSVRARLAGSGERVWRAPLGERTAVTLDSQAWNARQLAGAALAVAAGALLVAVLVRRAGRAARRSRGRHAAAR